MNERDILQAISEGRWHAPHDVLGLHTNGSARVVRVLRPLADEVWVVTPAGTRFSLSHWTEGIWHGVVDNTTTVYDIEARYGAQTSRAADPYRHAPTIGELDLHLIGEGRHEELWRALGARILTDDGIAGVSFTVWAPRAQAVRVVGSFNEWDGRLHAMRSLGASGVWELFVPTADVGTTYKFEILTQNGDWILKADPMARAAELPPATASVVTASTYEWQDADWLDQRASQEPAHHPMSIYELHVGSWRPGLTYRQLADELIPYVTNLGFTHVEFMPLAEHPFGGSWGYQVSGYYAPTSRFGTPDDLRYLIDRLHQAGIGVIIDWVPGHFPKDAFALARFDGEALYEHPDPRRGEHRDWGTYIFDYGRNEVRGFLVANALYWIEEFHVDGLRVDAVASMLYLDYSRESGEWEPNIHGGRENLEAIRFLQEVNATAYKKHAGIAMIAEESTSFPGVTAPTSDGGLGFGFKWNMGWMNDSLRYITVDPMYRNHHHGEITFSFAYAFSENYVLPISHDEVVHGKGTLLTRMPGSHANQLAGTRGYLGYMWAHPGKQLLFMGQEFGQMSEWAESRGLDWYLLEQPSHQGLSRFVTDLNRIYRESEPLWSHDGDASAFRLLGEPTHHRDVVAFSRITTQGIVVSVTNFSGATISQLELMLPRGGTWHEILNSDATMYGGAGIGNFGAVGADESGRAHVTIAPLGTIWLRHGG